MRSLIIPFSLWLAALQLPFYPTDIRSISGAGELVSIAVGLAGLTVAVYRLGVWRQEMRHTKDTVVAELARFRQESHQNFARLERRIDQLEKRWHQEAA